MDRSVGVFFVYLGGGDQVAVLQVGFEGFAGGGLYHFFMVLFGSMG